MKKWLGAACVSLALLIAGSLPASALAGVLTSDSFSTKASVDTKWVTDRYAPAEFSVTDGVLTLGVGLNGFYRSRTADHKDTYYSVQGRKIALKTPSSNTWTAAIKIDIDSSWFDSSSSSKRFEFRVDLQDNKGNEIEHSPTLALVKNGSDAPTFYYSSPKSSTGWGVTKTYLNGDMEREDFAIDEDGWHTLMIRCTSGTITYWMDNIKLGNCGLSQKNVYPTYAAVGLRNYDAADEVLLDNFALYNGVYQMRPLRPAKEQEEYEEEQEEKYEEKREKWLERYTKYADPDDDDEEIEYKYTMEQMKRRHPDMTEEEIEASFDSDLTKEIPDRLWKY